MKPHWLKQSQEPDPKAVAASIEAIAQTCGWINTQHMRSAVLKVRAKYELVGTGGPSQAVSAATFEDPRCELCGTTLHQDPWFCPRCKEPMPPPEEK